METDEISTASAPSLDNMNVYVTTPHGELIALNRYNGSRKWEVSGVIEEKPIIVDNTLYTWSSNKTNNLIAISTTKGDRLFESDQVGKGELIFTNEQVLILYRDEIASLINTQITPNDTISPQHTTTGSGFGILAAILAVLFVMVVRRDSRN